ncbi:MAG: DUF4437 domain-containing protein [Steroidobacteraceae bacterium]|nr:DUF4437 domain-containing protein [Nevskiaceae bacterium]MCP5338912.1 DUF4437 domain-containing protein [Nevskiaceae bacterium]MCP5466172.1 DUF4437 domain-containing protein [Nevskiaceae bacterium]MCP5471575.1 DUF4437 domain-containing protein [Nevskiaceae bacterium]
MGRPWIEFVQSQRLPWERGLLDALRPGIETKLLSRDPQSGGCSLLVRYPAGFSSSGGALRADDEFLVLDGALEIGDQRYAELGYAHLPAGFATGTWAAPDGAIVLEFFSAEPAHCVDSPCFDQRRLVLHRDAFQVPYTGNFHPEFPPGAGRKLLYQDPLTEDTTWLLGTLPIRWAERSEIHPVVEEMYLLAGEVHGDRGIMRPGAYFWRPPFVPHGPYGTQTGNLYFFRTRGGGLSTTYVDAARPFRWRPDYDAVLPAEYEFARGEVADVAARW